VGMRRWLVQNVGSSELMGLLTKPLMYFFALVSLTLAFSARNMARLNTGYHQACQKELNMKLQHESQMFQAQRDFCIVGFAALLILVVGRVYQMMKEISSLSASKYALEKQAANASAAYKMVQEEKEALEKAAKAKAEAAATAAGAGGDDKEAELDTLRGEKERLLGLVKAKEAEADSAVASATALKKQAEGLSAEYARVMGEKESLENKLADFELVMGDEAKKKK